MPKPLFSPLECFISDLAQKLEYPLLSWTEKGVPFAGYLLYIRDRIGVDFVLGRLREGDARAKENKQD